MVRRYQRILSGEDAHYDDNDDDVDHHHHHADEKKQQQQPKRSTIRRREPTYTSIGTHDDHGDIHDDTANNERKKSIEDESAISGAAAAVSRIDEILQKGSNNQNSSIKKHDSDENEDEEGEMEPFRGSFDQDELEATSNNGAVGRSSKSNSRASSPGPLQVATAVVSPISNSSSSLDGLPSQQPPKQSFIANNRPYSSSFDLDDDDDDDDIANLKRYNLDFSNFDRQHMRFSQHGATPVPTTPTATNSPHPLRSPTSLHGGTYMVPSLRNESNDSSNSISSCMSYLWFSFQLVRQQARQRRAQRLLNQQSERNWKQSLWICLMTTCDATDRGILLVVFLMVLWIILLWHTSSTDARFRLWIVGITLFTIRVTARPAFEYFHHQWSFRRRRLKGYQQKVELEEQQKKQQLELQQQDQQQKQQQPHHNQQDLTQQESQFHHHPQQQLQMQRNTDADVDQFLDEHLGISRTNSGLYIQNQSSSNKNVAGNSSHQNSYLVGQHHGSPLDVNSSSALRRTSNGTSNIARVRSESPDPDPVIHTV